MCDTAGPPGARRRMPRGHRHPRRRARGPAPAAGAADQRARPRQRGHRDPRRGRRRAPTRSWSATRRSTCTRPRWCASTAGSLFHLPRGHRAAGRGDAGAAARGRHPRPGRRRRRHDPAARRRPAPAARLGDGQRGVGARRRRCATCATTWSGCRSTARPSRSTSRWPPRCASTPLRARTRTVRVGAMDFTPGHADGQRVRRHRCELIPDGLVAADGDGKILFLNRRGHAHPRTVPRGARRRRHPRGASTCRTATARPGGTSPTRGAGCGSAPATARSC